MRDLISRFADIIALIYHEGRNVRHLAREVQVEQKYLVLRDSLATNRVEAWKQIQPLLQEATSALSGSEVQRVFHHRFGLTLEDLATLYKHPSWKDAPSRGGNAWLSITIKAIEVRDFLELGRENEVHNLIEEIMESVHNNGKVSIKLHNLKKSLES